jgi:hypothetical protein
VLDGIELLFLRPNGLHMFTNALLLGSKLAEGRREFQKDLGRSTECILRDASGGGVEYSCKGTYRQIFSFAKPPIAQSL